ncbi:hypothetical protein PG999_012584 [Apiospora kogelbergensis]|uniref:Uncharacterized protein n=1 Tax=Apiospora kogelbergensis TaxID=1337665 RepID=A0AAW0Q7C0_9PEZI
MKLIFAVLSSYIPGAALAMTTMPIIGDRAAGDGEVVELCPNTDFQAIDSSIPCLNYTDPTRPRGYGQRDTCNADMGGDFLTFGDRTVSLEGSPLHVGSPQGVSSVRLYGSLNCTLYKTENCEPDTPTNGHIVGGTGESHLYAGAGPGDPAAIDDRTVAFRCRRPKQPRVQGKPHSVSSMA